MKNEEILKIAKEQFEESDAVSRFNRENYKDDVRFARMSEQWDEDIKNQRMAEGRPCLTTNKLAPLIRQIVNESRQAKPAIKVSPVDNGADVATAEVISGLIKAIERESNADIAYDTAFDHCVSGGFGFFRIGVDYVAPDSFDLKATIKRVPNPLMVHWDVNSTEFDASDWTYGFVSELISKDDFEKQYPKAAAVDWEGDNESDTERWRNGDDVRIAEYFTRHEKEIEVLLLSDGQIIRRDELPKLAKDYFGAGGIDLGPITDDDVIAGFFAQTGLNEQRSRKTFSHDVTRYIMSGNEILEQDEWLGTMIPICPVWGDEVIIDNRRHFRSLIRDAKDPQRMHNFWRSASTELVALAPRTPFIMPEGAMPRDGQERAKWSSANTRSHAYLAYAGNQAPQRQPFAGVPGGAVQEAISSNQDIQDITGIYPSSIGARSNETSGRAILARERQGDVSNFHFSDNLSRAISYAGKCLVEIIPAIYSTRKAIRVLGEDQKEKVVNLSLEAGGDPDNGLYNISVGRYDVVVDTGPSFATQREETRETLIEIMRQVPGAAQVIGDIVVEHLDFQGADKVAKRLQALLPPQMQQAEGAAPPVQQAPGVDPAAPANPIMGGNPPAI